MSQTEEVNLLLKQIEALEKHFESASPPAHLPTTYDGFTNHLLMDILKTILRILRQQNEK